MYVYILWAETYDPYDECSWTQALVDVYRCKEDADARRLDLEHEAELRSNSEEDYGYETNYSIEERELR